MALSVPPRVELFYSGIWNDITTYVRTDPAISIKRGRDSEDSDDTPSSCSFVLNNGDGRFSPRNPTSPLYGLIGRNSQVRVGLGVPPIGATSTVVTASTSLVAPSVIAEASGIQVGVWATYPINDITAPSGFTEISEVDVGSILTVSTATKAITAGATGTATATAAAAGTSYAATTVALAGATYVGETTATGSSGNDANVSRSVTAGNFALLVCTHSEDPTNRMQVPKMGGVNAAAAIPDQGAGPFLITDSGAAGVQTPRTRVFGFWVPATGSVTVSQSGTRDGAGSAAVSIVEFSGVTAYYPRFVGEVSEFPVEWAKTGVDAWTSIEASGISRRLGSSNQSSAGSSIYESFTRNANAVSYWPLEDGTEAGMFASGLPSGAAMTFAPGAASGNELPVLSVDSTLPGSKALPTFTKAGGIGLVPSYGLRAGASAEEVSFGCIVGISNAGTAAGANFYRAQFNGGSINGVSLEYTNNTDFNLKVDFNDGTAQASNTVSLPTAAQVFGGIGGFANEFYMIFVRLRQSGADVERSIAVIQITPKWGITNPVTFTGGTYNATLTSKTLGKADKFLLGVEGGAGNTNQTNAPVFGHAFVTNSFEPFNTQDQTYSASSAWALTAWNGAKVSDRLHRLGQDSSVLVYVRHNDADLNLGYQVPDTLYEQLRDAAHGGVGGQLSDSAGFLGYFWTDRIYKENNAPRLTFTYGSGVLEEPLMPVDDDRLTRNDVTATRRGGASARAVRSTGALSILAPPAGVGRYISEEEYSLQLDSTAVDVAGWILNAGTVDEARWPNVAFNLSIAANLAKITTMRHLAIGDTIRLSGFPVWVPPGPISGGAVDLIVNGYTEFIGFENWKFNLNCSSTAPFFASEIEPSGQAATLGAGRIGDNGLSTLVSGVTSTATSLSVATSSLALWTTAAADLPFRIYVSGEEMSVTAVTGTTSPQTFTVTRSVNGIVKAQSAGAAITTPAPIIGL